MGEERSGGGLVRSLPRPFAWLFGLYSTGILALVLSAAGVPFPLLLPYAWHKLLHVAGVVLFLGNAVVEAVWMSAALKTGEPRVIRFAARVLTWGDVWLLAGGFSLALVNGVFLASSWGGLFRHSWLAASLILLGIAGTLGMAVLPAQVRIWKLTQDGAVDPGAPLPPDFHAAIRTWSIWGSLSVLPLLGILWLMFLKPVLW